MFRELRSNERFEVVRKLGAGGMGVVYEVVDRQRQARVALKLLQQGDPGAIERFKREFRVLQDLEHPNLVRLLELVVEGDAWAFTMELVDGCDFITWACGAAARDGALDVTQPGQGNAAGGACDERRLRPALRQLALGLGALHRAGKVHRDVKPSNVLVRPDGRVVLLDFGLASDLDDPQRSSENVVGTVEYMAPEQAAGSPAGPEADWYSVGALLYEVLAGRPPFKGKTLRVLQDKQVKSPPPLAGGPVDLERLAMDLLQIDPAARPDLGEILRRLGDEAPAPAAGDAEVFVGRARELALLHEALAKARAGRAQVVLVDGPAGIGKSALVSHFLRTLDSSGTVVLASRHYERESYPYRGADGALEALSRFLARLPEAEIDTLLPPDAPLMAQVFPSLRRLRGWPEPAVTEPVVEPRELRRRLFEAVRETFQRLARRYPLVIAIEDIQRGDNDGRLMVANSMRDPSPPVLCVMTLRSQAGDEAYSRAWFERMRSWCEVTDLHLGPLEREDARRLAAHLVGEDGDRAARIAEEADGHPLFIDALVRHDAAPQLRLEDALAARIDGLEPATRRLLELLALAGGRAPLDTALRASGLAYPELLRSVGTLSGAGLARHGPWRDREVLEILHERVRETVLDRLAPDAQRELHGRLAETLEALGADAEELLRHHLGAGNLARAADCATIAAERADAALAFVRAVGLYRQALELSQDPEEQRRLGQRLEQALAHAGRHAAAKG